METTWKQVPNTGGRYSASIYGEIHDIERNKIINPHMSGVKRRNYPQVTLYVKHEGVRKKKTKRVHSIMAETFLGYTYDGNRKIMVDHIDNNPLNNKLSNLRIVTAKENYYKNKINK